MTRRWPESLPGVLADNYRLSPQEVSLRTDMEVGARRLRRLSHARADRVQVSWLFDDREMEAFRAWFDDEPRSLTGASDDLSAWTAVALTVAPGSVVTPAGDLATRLQATGAATAHYLVWIDIAAPAGAVMQFRVTVKAAGQRHFWFWVQRRDGSFAGVIVDLQDELLLDPVNLTAASLVRRDGGWVTVTIETAIPAGAVPVAAGLHMMSPALELVHAGGGGALDVCEVATKRVTGCDLYLPTGAAGRVLGAAGGAAWFRTRLFMGGGWSDCEARFEGPFDAPFAKGATWTVSAGLEVRDA